MSGIGGFFKGLSSGLRARSQIDGSDGSTGPGGGMYSRGINLDGEASRRGGALSIMSEVLSDTSSRSSGGMDAMPKGGGGSIDPNGLYNYLLDRGATRNQAIMLTGAAGAESSWNPNLVHDKGTGFGLWGHRNERLSAMREMAGSSRPSWQQQADYALHELRVGSDPGARRANAILSEAASPQEIAIAQMHYERPIGYRPDKPSAGHNFDYRLKLVSNLFSSAGGSPRGGAMSYAPSAPSRPSSGGAMRAINDSFSGSVQFAPIEESPIQRSIIRDRAQPAAMTPRGARAIMENLFSGGQP